MDICTAHIGGSSSTVTASSALGCSTISHVHGVREMIGESIEHTLVAVHLGAVVVRCSVVVGGLVVGVIVCVVIRRIVVRVIVEVRLWRVVRRVVIGLVVAVVRVLIVRIVVVACLWVVVAAVVVVGRSRGV
jgi:hypothetical protein